MNWEDYLFKIANLLFNFIFWVILDKNRFWTSWFIFVAIITIFFLFLIKREIDDKKGDRS
jgi:hypothetical protein